MITRSSVLIGVSVLLIPVIVFAVGWKALDTIASKGTVYAPRYAETAFRQVSEGMTPAQTERLLGPPLRKEMVYSPCGLAEAWVYTRQRDDKSWWYARQVLFDAKTHRVCHIVRCRFEP